MNRQLTWCVIACAVALALTLVRTRIRAGDGFNAEYFNNDRWDGSPAIVTVDRRIDTRTLTDRWGDALPAVFSVRWVGYLAVGRPGTYTFTITSDDGSRLLVDNRVVIDDGGTHGARTGSGAIALTAGSHLVVIEYAQQGGAFALSWSWGRAAARPIADDGDAWAISTRPATYAATVGGRAISALRSIALVVAGLSFLLAAFATDAPRWAAAIRSPKVVTAVLFVALAVLETWPLATDLAHLSRNDNADTVLNEWVLAWVAHQLPRHPLQLFDANIFYPERHTLGYAETLLMQSAIASPLIWSGASPVFAYNVTLLAGLALSGWAMCLVVASWTRDWTAGIASGVIAAFNGNTLTRLPHLQAQHTEFVPLALFALDSLLCAPDVRAALALALWFVLDALASYYLMVIGAFGLAAAALSRSELWRRGTRRRVLRALALAAIIALAALAPVLLGYWQVYHGQGFTRPIDSLIPAEWRDYVTSGSHVNEYLFQAWYGHFGLAPNLGAMLLAGVAIACGRAVRDPRCRMCAALGLCGLVLSFGARVPGYALLYSVFVPLHGIRAVARFGYLAIAGVAVMAGFGVDSIRRRLAPGTMRALVSAGIVVLLVADSIAAPLDYTRVGDVPRIYARPPSTAVVIETPLPFAMADNARFMLHSTIAWYGLVNGYSGFVPASYFAHYDAMHDFPSPPAIEAMRAAGITHVFVDRTMLPPDRVQQLRNRHALQELDEFGAIALYAIGGAHP